jgi:hypothetical protein
MTTSVQTGVGHHNNLLKLASITPTRRVRGLASTAFRQLPSPGKSLR